MRYVRLTATGDGSMSAADARRYVAMAKTRSGNVAGEVMMTAPDSNGTYFVAFGNHAHATHFIDLARPRGIRLESLTELPPGITLQRRPRAQQPQPGAEEIVVILLDGATDILEALFRRPGRPGNGK